MYLWKEWCEHRRLLLALLVQMALVGLAVPHLPDAIHSKSWFVPTAALLAASLLGSELFAEEARRDRLRLLHRLPGGLAHAFRAKATLLAIACAALAVVAAEPLLALPAFAVGLWILGVSTWLPNGSLAVPAGLLSLGAVGSGYLVARVHNPWLEPTTAETVLWLLVLFPLASITLAALSVRGSRWSRGPRHAALAGVPILVACTAACTVWNGARSAVWNRARPERVDFFIWSAIVGPAGKRAYVTAGRKGAHVGYALTVDLATGDWSQHESAASVRFESAAFVNRASPPFHNRAGLHDLVIRVTYRGDHELYEWLDGRTGVVLVAQTERHAPPSLEQRIRRTLRDTTSLHLADGRRAWIFRGLEAEAPGGHTSLPWTEGDIPLAFDDTGIRVKRGGRVVSHVLALAGDRERPNLADPDGRPTYTPAGTRVYLGKAPGKRCFLARTGRGSAMLRIHFDTERVSVLACPDEETAIVSTGTTIERIRWSDATRTRLFPRQKAGR